MSRPIWKGHISFGLVYIPVTLYTAEKSKDLQFHLVDSRDNSRIRYERRNETTGKEVPWNEVVKAYEYSKGHYVILEEEDFKKAAVESSQTIEILHFIEEKSIPDIYFQKPYYLVPDKKGEKGYVLLRETLAHTKKVGIAKVVIRTRQYLAAVSPVEDALVLDLLHFADELIEPDEYAFPHGAMKNYKITTKELEISEQLVKAMSAEWKPEQYHDDYRQALLELIKKKEKGLPVEVKTAKKPEAKVIDFMSLLKKSVEEKKGGKASKRTKRSTARAHGKHKKHAR